VVHCRHSQDTNVDSDMCGSGARQPDPVRKPMSRSLGCGVCCCATTSAGFGDRENKRCLGYLTMVGLRSGANLGFGSREEFAPALETSARWHRGERTDVGDSSALGQNGERAPFESQPRKPHLGSTSHQFIIAAIFWPLQHQQLLTSSQPPPKSAPSLLRGQATCR
jgi:hypothetical protein